MSPEDSLQSTASNSLHRSGELQSPSRVTSQKATRKEPTRSSCAMSGCSGIACGTRKPDRDCGTAWPPGCRNQVRSAHTYFAYGPTSARHAAPARQADSRETSAAKTPNGQRPRVCGPRPTWQPSPAATRQRAMLQDVRFALRQLRRTPVFAVVTVLTFGLGMGANAAVFSVMNAVVLKLLPVGEADRLVFLHTSRQPNHASQTGFDNTSLSVSGLRATACRAARVLRADGLRAARPQSGRGAASGTRRKQPWPRWSPATSSPVCA